MNGTVIQSFLWLLKFGGISLPSTPKNWGGGGGKPNFEKTKVKNFFARGGSQCVVLSITVLPLGITQKWVSGVRTGVKLF